MFTQWISAFDTGARRDIIENYLKFKQKNERRGSQIVLFTSVSLLRLMDRIMLFYNDLGLQEGFTAKVEMACFQAWLVNNTELAAEIQNSATPRPDNLTEILLITQASQYEYVERKDIFSQIMFSKSFFDYLSGNIDFKPYLTEFLACKNLKSSSQYLRALTEVYMMGAGEGFSFRLTPANQFLKSLFDSFTLPIPNEDQRRERPLKANDPDFKAFRVSPLVRIDENSYYILHHNFFVDKLYKGLLFDFFKETSIHKRFRDFPAFLQILGSEFAEKNIFYEYVSGWFGKNSYVIKVPGDRYPNIECTDFYVREGKSIFLFEFKNALVSTAVKQSMDYQTIEQEIFKKLVRNERGKPKGVTQLLKVIKDLVSKPFPFDDFVAKGSDAYIFIHC
ncbi:hypothetical protein Dfri01_55730 [Dyadobacter frigoris]|uniref:hypothetical protein n=1 Tax=Dyadobacter frigoris TaxID=2576211 RepID=UPI0024A50BF4|nr:hypothetical protein [Dyadobacter frigoris]GLU56112.1 hypothetical protein Dfri01_55730 [Dyadobacter frigoris]